MIDHLLGRPSTSLKRLQVLAVLAFWGTVLKQTPAEGPKKFNWVRWANSQAARYPPWKLVTAVLMLLYSVRHIDSIFGFGAPEPLARMYSRSFYRVTWIVTALDAGFATALNVKPLWLRDILSVVFSLYYVLYANEADEKLRKYRAFCTLEMMRYTWEKTTNPYIRMVTWFQRPSLPIARQILLPRPTLGAHSKRPIKAWLFYAGGKEPALAQEEELYLDFPGGGFICMNPLHHEERLRQIAREVQRPVLAVDYCKAPEYPYPFALEECFDLYRTLFETRGKAIGMSGSSRFRVVLSGDSAGGNIATAVMLKILEYPQPHIRAAFSAINSRPPPLPKPLCMILAYPSLNFSFTAWMRPDHLRVLKAQSEVNLQNLQAQASADNKAARRGSPLRPRSRSRSRTSNHSKLGPAGQAKGREGTAVEKKQPHGFANRAQAQSPRAQTYLPLASQAELHLADRARFADAEPASDEPGSPAVGSVVDAQEHENRIWQKPDSWYTDEQDERQRELAESQQKADAEMNEKRKKTAVGTRLTMTSMSGYFQDRVLSQSMMRAMAILYIGPRKQPDFEHEYLLSPVVAPARLLAEFPPVLFICGEKDPICDDTVVMAGRIREAKLAKQAELKRRRAGASARFGEGLRMSAGGTHSEEPVEPIEEEDVEDWVQMRIIASVSHGLLQMSALWPEAKHIISFICAWVVDSFEDETDRLEELRQQDLEQRRATGGKGAVPTKAQTLPAPATDAAMRSPRGAQTQLPATSAALPQSDDVEADDEADEPLSFTPKRMRSPSMRPSPRVEMARSPLSSSHRWQESASDAQIEASQASARDSATGEKVLEIPAVAALRRSEGEDGAGSARGPGADQSGAVASNAPGKNRTRPSSFSDVVKARTALLLKTGADDTVPQSPTDILHSSPHSSSTASSGLGISPSSAHAIRGNFRRSSFAGSGATRSSTELGDDELLGSGLGRSRSPNAALSGGRRASRGPGAGMNGGTGGIGMDERTRGLLVQEGSLLQRRRDEAISSLGQSAVHSSSDEEDKEESPIVEQEAGAFRGRRDRRE